MMKATKHFHAPQVNDFIGGFFFFFSCMIYTISNKREKK